MRTTVALLSAVALSCGSSTTAPPCNESSAGSFLVMLHNASEFASLTPDPTCPSEIDVSIHFTDAGGGYESFSITMLWAGGMGETETCLGAEGDPLCFPGGLGAALECCSTSIPAVMCEGAPRDQLAKMTIDPGPKVTATTGHCFFTN